MQTSSRFPKRLIACVVAVLVAGGLMVPSAAFADVRVNGTQLNQGSNDVGGGTATLSETVLDMVNVVAETLDTDQDLTINFNGGNEIDDVSVGGSATVEMNFTGENEVEDVMATENSNVTINADGHNEFDEVEALDNSKLTINVTGENDFESIEGSGNASIIVRGETCQRRDIINLGDDEGRACLATSNGDLTIDHVTVNLKAKRAFVGSEEGSVLIDTSKVAKDDGNEYAFIEAGRAMKIRESVIEIVGTVFSRGKMVIDHSDVKAEKPDSKYDDDSPYRVLSETGIELIREKNGEVNKGTYHENDVWYVDTDDNDGKDVDLKADGKPGYYKCGDDSDTRGMPKTGDTTMPVLPIAVIAVALTAIYATRRLDEC